LHARRLLRRRGRAREIFRVLHPGGMLAFSITHPCFITKGAQWVRDAEGSTPAS